MTEYYIYGTTSEGMHTPIYRNDVLAIEVYPDSGGLQVRNLLGGV